MAMNVSAVLTQIDDVLQQWRNIRGRSAHDDCSDLPDHETAELVGKLTSTLDRLAPQGTHHRRNLDLLFKKFGDSRVGIPSLVGAVNALRSDYQNAYLQTFEELVHASMFSGFLDMAEHLHSTGYKDAAAVIVGSVLEQHLRELCTKNKIATHVGTRAQKADQLNSELSSSSIYSKLDQKNVTAWLGLRNDAAHGNYAGYTADQVRLMLDAVRDFMTRNPA